MFRNRNKPRSGDAAHDAPLRSRSVDRRAPIHHLGTRSTRGPTSGCARRRRGRTPPDPIPDPGPTPSRLPIFWGISPWTNPHRLPALEARPPRPHPKGVGTPNPQFPIATCNALYSIGEFSERRRSVSTRPPTGAHRSPPAPSRMIGNAQGRSPPSWPRSTLCLARAAVVPDWKHPVFQPGPGTSIFKAPLAFRARRGRFLLQRRRSNARQSVSDTRCMSRLRSSGNHHRRGPQQYPGVFAAHKRKSQIPCRMPINPALHGVLPAIWARGVSRIRMVRGPDRHETVANVLHK